MIYLFVENEGWEKFEVTDTAELEKRGIHIGGGAHIESEAYIESGAHIGSGAVIGSGAKPIIIYIIGSRFPVSYWGEDRIDIGCQSRSIDEWLTDYAGIAKEYEFTTCEIEEYRGYVEFIKSVHIKEESGGVSGI
jgi:hypothetical protein